MDDKNTIDLIARVLAGQTRSVAQMLSLAEAGGKEARAALAEIYRHTGHAHVVGLTGVSGSGKSTLVRLLAMMIRGSGRKVGIVAVDPSSPFSGGSILGDRVRMTDLSGDDGFFIRSMATRGAVGGLARACLDAVDILDAAGFDLVLVESVGVGQDEVDIVLVAHTVVVVSVPGLGDDVQTTKAGILETADIHVVNKFDRADANKTVSELKRMLSFGPLKKSQFSWAVPVVPTSAENNEGIEALLAAIDGHRTYLEVSGDMERRRARMLELRVLKNAEDIIRTRFTRQGNGRLQRLLQRMMARELDPYTAAVDLLDGCRGD